MMLSKTLEGAVVERVYYAVLFASWLPVIGEPFETFAEARDYAEQQMFEKEKPEAMITSRIVFRRVDGVREDMEFDRTMRYRKMSQR